MDQKFTRETGGKYEFNSFVQSLLENTQSIGILIIDPDGYIIESNLAVYKSFGYTKEYLKGKCFDLMFTSEDQKKKLPQIELINVYQKGSWTDNNYICHKNGAKIWVNGESILIKDEGGKEYILKIVVDINQQKLLEEFLIKSQSDLKEINNDLIRTNNDLDTFVYTASHDLKTPISNLEALLNSIRDELEDEKLDKATIVHMVNLMSNSIDKFKSTINDLTTIGNIQKGQDETASEINICKIVEDIKFDFKEEIQKFGIKFFEDYKNAETIMFSKKNLRSILYNLISNAIKYRSNERPPYIRINTDRIDSYVIISVSDNGLGLKEKDREKVFTMYKRFHDHVPGSGIGMSIVKKMVDNSGGKIEVKSEFGQGSTFTLFLRV